MSKSWKKGRASFLCRHHLSARRWEDCEGGGRTAQRHGLIVRKTWTTRRPPRSDVTGIRRSRRKSRVKTDVFWVILNSRGSFLFCELLLICVSAGKSGGRFKAGTANRRNRTTTRRLPPNTRRQNSRKMERESGCEEEM